MLNFTFVNDYQAMSQMAAERVAAALEQKPDLVMALPTGSTPVGMLKAMSTLSLQGKADFSRAVSFNMDEYIALTKDNAQGYFYFLNDLLYQHIDIAQDNCFVPNVLADDLDAEAQAYEALIQSHGGLDICVLGIGTDGHISFNMPDQSLSPECHIVELSQETIEANARFFDNREDVPRRALTLGIKTILTSKEIILIANGESKADVMQQLHQCQRVDPQLPASFLLLHPNVTIICDSEAASKIDIPKPPQGASFSENDLVFRLGGDEKI